MNLRALRPEDLEAYRSLRLRGLCEAPRAFGSSYEEEVDRDYRPRLEPGDGRVTFGVFLDGQLVGVTTLMREARLKTRHRASILGVYTAPEARGKGVARALLQAALAEARTWDGVVLLNLGVTAGNEPARQLYRSVGFITVGVQPAFLKVDGQLLDEEQMVLFLC